MPNRLGWFVLLASSAACSPPPPPADVADVGPITDAGDVTADAFDALADAADATNDVDIDAQSDAADANMSSDAPIMFGSVQAIFDHGCASIATGGSCHRHGGTMSTLVLEGDAYNVVVRQPSTEVPSMLLVVPGSLTDSYLFRKIDNTFRTIPDCMTPDMVCGAQMPKLPFNPLRPSEIDTIRRWILAGAPM